MWQVSSEECQQNVSAGAVLALAVLVVSLLAQGDSQGGEIKYCTALQLCFTLPACPWENNFISMFHQPNCTKHLVLLCIITFTQPCLFIPETPQSRCWVWFWILHHNKSSFLMGWAVVPQLVVVIILLLLLSRWCNEWTLPRFDFSQVKTHSYNLNSFVCYCN